jgi:hypothetical protein
MGPQTVAEHLNVLAPIIWTCGGGLTLIVVMVKLFLWAIENH